MFRYQPCGGPHPSSSAWSGQVPVSVGSPGQGPGGKLPEAGWTAGPGGKLPGAGGRQVLFLVLTVHVAGWQEQELQGLVATQEPGGGTL
jgi:hypothetical protein